MTAEEVAREDRPSGGRQARLVAGVTALDARRRPATWRTTLLAGVVIALMVAGSSAVSERVQSRAEAISYAVAVDGDLDGARGLLDQLAGPRLVLRPSGDAEADVRNASAATGIRLPPDVDGRLDRGESVELALYLRESQENSRQAYNEVLLRLQELEVGWTSDGVSSPAPVRVVENQVARDDRVSRLQLARTLAALVPFLCLTVVSSVAALLGTGRQQRTLEPLLTLPTDRRSLAAGLVLGAAPTGILPVVAAEVVLVATSALPVVGLAQPLASVLVMLAVAIPAAVLLGGLACATGGLAGALGAGGDDTVALGDFLSLPFVVVGAVLLLRPDVPSVLPAYAVPILGPALGLRDGVSGTLGAAEALLVVGSTAVWVVLLVLATARRLPDERRLARS